MAGPINLSVQPIIASNKMGRSASYRAESALLTGTVCCSAALRGRPELGRPYVAGDIKDYYWPRNPLLDSQYLRPRLVQWIRDSEDENDVLRKFRQNRIGCLVHWTDGSLAIQGMVGGYAWTGRELRLLQKFMCRHLEPLDLPEAGPADNPYRFYRLTSRPAAPRPPGQLRLWYLPYTEALYADADALLAAGKTARARTEYRRLARRYPAFAVPLLRLAEAARLSGNLKEQTKYERLAEGLLK